VPTYEYRCVRGHAFDVFQKMSDEPVAQCPECGQPASRMVSGGAGFLFKGEGFYITDYRSQDYKKKAEAEQMHSPGSAEKPAQSGESAASQPAPAPPKAAAGEGGKEPSHGRRSSKNDTSGAGGSAASGKGG
jgi:putative FmdB family regulatory protein